MVSKFKLNLALYMWWRNCQHIGTSVSRF